MLNVAGSMSDTKGSLLLGQSFLSKFKSIAVLLIVVSLTSCVAAVVAGAAAGLVYDRRTVSTIEADARLFHVIHTAIVTDPQFRSSRVLVTSFNRVILLVGQASSASLRIVAERIARTAPGVPSAIARGCRWWSPSACCRGRPHT